MENRLSGMIMIAALIVGGMVWLAGAPAWAWIPSIPVSAIVIGAVVKWYNTPKL